MAALALFLAAVQFLVPFVAVIRVAVLFVLLKLTDQITLYQSVTRVAVLMAGALLQTADQLLLGGVAVRCMGVGIDLRQGTDQLAVRVIAVLVVDVDGITGLARTRGRGIAAVQNGLVHGHGNAAAAQDTVDARDHQDRQAQQSHRKPSAAPTLFIQFSDFLIKTVHAFHPFRKRGLWELSQVYIFLPNSPFYPDESHLSRR